MVQYRRNRIEGGTDFFTVPLRDRRGTLRVDQIDARREAVRIVRRENPFHRDARMVGPRTCTTCGDYRKVTRIITAAGG